MTEKRILVLFPSLYDKENLAAPQFKDGYEFIFEGSYDPNQLEDFDPQSSIQQIVDKYQHQQLDGVLGTEDYPGCLLAAIIAHKLELPAPPLLPLFNCQHKYNARQYQNKIVPEATPQFAHLNPYQSEIPDPAIDYPFFMKPVKSAASIMAKKITDPETLKGFLPLTLSHFETFAKPFNALLSQYTDIPLEFTYLLCEELLQGVQVTVEGFVWQGQVTMMGVVDSVMFPGTISFERFEYPSKLPISVQARMGEIASKVIQGIGLNNCMFNIEMFYDSEADKITIIEINPRMSYQFADLYESVDGTNSYDIKINLCLEQKPHFQHGQGQYNVAVSFARRIFSDKVVQKNPTEAQIQAFKRQFPEGIVYSLAQEGSLLSDYLQDEESYRFGYINLGGQSWEDVYTRHEEALAIVPVILRDVC